MTVAQFGLKWTRKMASLRRSKHHSPFDRQLIIRSIAAIVAACLVIPTAVQAVPFTVGTNAPLVMDAGTSAGSMLVNIVNTTPSDNATDFLTGWQLSLAIFPDVGSSTGAVGFVSATEPLSNYLLGLAPTTLGVTTIPNSIPPLSNTLLVLDSEFAFPANGVEVPDGAGANLLDLTFSASPNASGTFGIFLDQTAPNSVWTDAGTISNQAFDNTADTLDANNQLTLARIGTVQVIAAPVAPGVVPEPVTAMLGILSFGALGATLTRRR